MLIFDKSKGEDLGGGFLGFVINQVRDILIGRDSRVIAGQNLDLEGAGALYHQQLMTGYHPGHGRGRSLERLHPRQRYWRDCTHDSDTAFFTTPNTGTQTSIQHSGIDCVHGRQSRLGGGGGVIRLVPNRTNYGLLRSDFATFLLDDLKNHGFVEPKYTKI